jgi:Fe-S-cluster containining protein
VTVPLSRPYPSRLGVPVLDRVDPDIFRLSYFGECLACTFCEDSCCQYGCDVAEPERRRILGLADALEPRVGRPAAEWFEPWTEPEPDYPGGGYTRTRVAAGRCVFLNRAGRGCHLHSFALETGRDFREVKPHVCWLFPVEHCGGELRVPLEIREGSLVCLGGGPTLYRSARPDLAHLFGPDLTAELDALETRLAPARPTLSLPLAVPDRP